MPKSENQKLKLLYIADFLMKETDEGIDQETEQRHAVYVRDIKAHLENKGIIAEEHSISRDISLLRDVFKMDIVGGRGKPYYLRSRYLPLKELGEISECIGSSKFISNAEARRLVDLLKRFCSKYQEERIVSDYFVAERPRQTQKDMLESLASVRKAIEKKTQITFSYTRHSVDNLDKVQTRRNGKRYKVSPFKVVLSEGNHYLIGYDAFSHRITPYRIDRMTGITPTREPNDGEEKFLQMGISDYARQTFGMFIGGKAKRITLQFDNKLLDAVLERFGNSRGTEYRKIDDRSFTLTTAIVPSPLFYGWIFGFGKMAKILDPDVANGFEKYLDGVKDNYQ